MTPTLRNLDETELLEWLRLIRSDNIGPRTFYGLLDRFGTARAALDGLPALAARSSGRGVTVASVRDAEAELRAAQRGNIRFVAVCEAAYPASLRAIDSAPPLIAVKGRIERLQGSMVAIVGSRNASAAGLVFTERLAHGLGVAGHGVVSGLARGIDLKAHEGSLDTGTVAVLAGGHDRIYPAEHAGLVARIVEQGAVLTEMPLTWEPRGRDFPRRNRLVSGLSLGVVVVEAARRSGSLITARFANEQGREVFAVPGSPMDPRAEGTNDLLRQGATLCTSLADVLDVLRPMAGPGTASTALPGLKEPGGRSREAEPFWDELDLESSGNVHALSSLGQAANRGRAAAAPLAEPGPQLDAKDRIFDLIGGTSVSIDDLVRVSSMSASLVQSVLTELELENRITRDGANLLCRTQS